MTFLLHEAAISPSAPAHDAIDASCDEYANRMAFASDYVLLILRHAGFIG